MGSTIQRRPDLPFDSPSSSPRTASSGKPLGYPTSHISLGFAIGDGDKTTVGLRKSFGCTTKILQRDLARAARHIDCEIEQLFEFSLIDAHSLLPAALR